MYFERIHSVFTAHSERFQSVFRAYSVWGRDGDEW